MQAVTQANISTKELRQEKRLRAEKYDWIIAPHQSVRTALFVRGLRAEKKIGFKTWWNSFAFDTRVERPMELPDALRQLSLLTPVDPNLEGLLDGLRLTSHNRSPLFTRADLHAVPEWASLRVEKFAGTREKAIFLAPGSQWATKRWTPEGFAQVGRAYRERGYEVRLVGSGPERELCDEIVREIPGAINQCGTTSLADLARAFARGSLLIVNDSGLMHLGSVAGIPTVAVFGPTTLELGYRPWQDRALVVESDLTCRPCGKHGHQKCPIGTHACMKEIPASDILETAGLLESTR